MPGLLVFSRDPGATQQLVALLEAVTSPPTMHDTLGLRQLRAEVSPLLPSLQVFARPPADAMWIDAGRAPKRWSGHDDAAARRLISDLGAKMLLTGTSDIDESGDRALWRVARELGVPSHTVLDQRINLMQRFRDANGARTYPDWLYVRDVFDAEAIAAAGVTAPVRIVGDLHLSRLARRIAAIGDKEVAGLRGQWALPAGRRVILFASECGREMAAAGRAMPYDEVAELERLIESLEAGSHTASGGRSPNSLALLVRPHPRDVQGKYNRYVGRRASGLLIAVSAAGSSELAMKAADVIVGMNSSLLQDAHSLGRPTLSLTGHLLGEEAGAAR